jgi:hypothetical protein
MTIDKSGWSGDGDFTVEILEVLGTFADIVALKVEDAPASRAGSDYQFLANEIFVTFALETRRVAGRWLGVVPFARRVEVPRSTLASLESFLSERVGPADYSDEGMLQYLRTQRVVAPYQTRGYKLVEMVRIYAARAPRPSSPA